MHKSRSRKKKKEEESVYIMIISTKNSSRHVKRRDNESMSLSYVSLLLSLNVRIEKYALRNTAREKDGETLARLERRRLVVVTR